MVKINHDSSKARASILLLGTAVALVAHAEAAVVKRQSNETTTLNGTEINENVLRRNWWVRSSHLYQDIVDMYTQQRLLWMVPR